MDTDTGLAGEPPRALTGAVGPTAAAGSGLEPLLTGDELTALTRIAGAPRFPGVAPGLYDAVAPELHGLLDERLLASLVARGVLLPDGELLLPVEPLDAVLTAAFTSQVYVAAHRLAPTVAPGEFATVAYLSGEHGLVRHDVAEPFHSLTLEPTATTAAHTAPADGGLTDTRLAGTMLAGRLYELVDPSRIQARPRRRRHRGRLSGLVELIPPPEHGWRRATALTRTDDAGEGVRVDGFLAVFDGGADELWLVGEDPDASPDPDRPLLAEPASAADVRSAVTQFAAQTATGAPTGRTGAAGGDAAVAAASGPRRVVTRWRS